MCASSFKSEPDTATSLIEERPAFRSNSFREDGEEFGLIARSFQEVTHLRERFPEALGFGRAFTAQKSSRNFLGWQRQSGLGA